MQVEQDTDMRKARWNPKPLALTLLCLFWVCLAAVLPGVLIGLGDAQLYDSFIPTGAARVTANHTEDAVQAFETVREYKASILFTSDLADGAPVRDSTRITEMCELLLSQLALLREGGLLTASEIEIFSLLLAPASPGLELAAIGDEVSDRFIGIRATDDNGMLCEVRYDTQSEKSLALSLVLPKDALGVLPQPVNAQDGLRAYMEWLGVLELADFAISEQQGGAAIAYSPTADLVLARQSSTTPGGAYHIEYSIS